MHTSTRVSPDMSPEEAQYMMTLHQPSLQNSRPCENCQARRHSYNSSSNSQRTPSESNLADMASGVSAIEDCIETLFSKDATPESNLACTQALRLLAPSLLAMKQDPEDTHARWQCQLGEYFVSRAQDSKICSACERQRGQPRRLSVSKVLKCRKESCASRQELVKQILWDEEDVADFLHTEGVDEDDTDLADTLETLLGHMQSYSGLGDSGVWAA